MTFREIQFIKMTVDVMAIKMTQKRNDMVVKISIVEIVVVKMGIYRMVVDEIAN